MTINLDAMHHALEIMWHSTYRPRGREDVVLPAYPYSTKRMKEILDEVI